MEFNKDELVLSYVIATSRLSDIGSEVYESLFDDKGNECLYLPNDVESVISKYRKRINLEFDMIRSAASQYLDDNPSDDIIDEY